MKYLKKLLLIIISASILSVMLSVSAFAHDGLAYGAATVDTDNLNLRDSPSMTSTVFATLTEGDIVVVLERTNSEWYYINFQGVIGYVNTTYLRDVLTAENFSAVGRVTDDSVNIRSRPTTLSDALAYCAEETVVTVIGINSGWYKVVHDGLTGYIRSDLMTIIAGTRASSSSASASGSDSVSVSNTSSSVVVAPPPANLAEGERIAQFALGFLGTNYVWGGTSPSGFDCSGLVKYTYSQFGYSITRVADSQYRNDGVRVGRADLQPGDILCFSSNGSYVNHVGIYIGNDEFVHASSSSTGVIVSRLDSTYYTRVFLAGKRIV